MIDSLITYLPFSRINELKEFFLRNINSLKPFESVVYIDEVYSEYHKEILRERLPPFLKLKFGEWRDRSLCLLQIIEDFIEKDKNILIIDSDNLLPEDFKVLDDALEKKGYDFYNVLDFETKARELFLSRSISLGRVIINSKKINIYAYRVSGLWRGIFFVGPKQVVKISKYLFKKLNNEVISDLKKALMLMDLPVRRYLGDDTTLGFLYYYSNIKWVPYVIYTHHHPSQRFEKSVHKTTFKVLKAMALAQLARFLPKRKYPKVLWLFFRYKISQLGNGILNYLLR